MLLLLRSLLEQLNPIEPLKQSGSHGVEKPLPQMTAYEVESFSDFVRKPKRNDDDELTLIYMMQGA